MKKRLLILSLLVSAKLFGQAITNGGFESWNSTPYSNPVSWYSSNPQSIIMLGIVNVTEVTGFSGNAAHLQTYISIGDTDFGYITNTVGDPSKAMGGVPYSQKSTGITGYYRYNLPVKDTAILFIIFKKSGSVIGQYFFKIRGTGSQPSWTSFNYTFIPALALTPDSMIIAAASSNAITNKGIQNGSWLELDQLAFTGPNNAIAGGNFDAWNSLSEDIPIGWSITTGGPSGSGVSRTTNHYSGSYAVSLLTQPGGGGGGLNSAFVSNGVESPNNGPKGGQPYTNVSPDTLFGYYEYASPGNDSGDIYINLTKNGSSVGGTGMWLKKVASWTEFKVGFQAFTTPDTILISFGSSTFGPNATVGSVLTLDNIYLKSQPLAIINPNVASQQSIPYPNPSHDILNIKLSDEMQGSVSIHIYDMTGRVVVENIFTLNESILHLNTSNLKPGVYFYKVDAITGATQLNKFLKE